MLFAGFVIGVLRRQGDALALEVEGPAGGQVDGGAQRSFVGFGRGGLLDLQLAEQFRGEGVVVEAAAAVDADGAAGFVGAGRGQGFQAVQARAGEVAAQTADGDAAAFAVETVDRDARQALQRFGEVGIGEVGDVLGGDGVDHDVGAALDLQGVGDRGPVTGDDDCSDFGFIGRRRGGGRGRGLSGGRAVDGHGGDHRQRRV